ncbi:MAG: hypothetical protein DWQ19_12020 [Crenarchaeota archaeon]|nr:MAG: hypothetical protein DWQ19_12020 [Thermoproteota archaeon]
MDNPYASPKTVGRYRNSLMIKSRYAWREVRLTFFKGKALRFFFYYMLYAAAMCFFWAFSSNKIDEFISFLPTMLFVMFVCGIPLAIFAIWSLVLIMPLPGYLGVDHEI